MTANAESSSCAQIKVDVLLREYDTLRQEIISRTNNRFAIGGYLGAIVVFFCSQSQFSALVRWCVALGALVGLLLLWFMIGYLIEQAASRIAEVESTVNAILGEELLVYESRNRRRWFGAVGPRLLGKRPKPSSGAGIVSR